MRNIFVEKSYIKSAGETIPRPLSKISKLSTSLDLKCKVLNRLFLLYANLRTMKIQRNHAAEHLLLPNITLLKKTKSGLGLVPLSHFLHNFKRKIFLQGYSINLPNFIVWLFLIREILSNMCIVICCQPGSDVKNFEINLTFLIKPFLTFLIKLSTCPKSQDKNLNILRTKRGFKMK